MTRILATHVGSLPRTQDVVDFIFARESGEAVDEAAFDACMTGAVAGTVRRQVEAGIDIVSDGETSKISYATYVKDRYSGFSGDSDRNPPADLKLYPTFLKRLAESGGTPKYSRPKCTGEVRAGDHAELRKDIANLKRAMAEHDVERGFMNAASPGVISLFLPNEYYPSREAYLAALAEAMREEYEIIVAAGLDLQLDCPDLALSRHMLFADRSDDGTSMSSQTRFASQSWTNDRAIYLALAGRFRGMKTPSCSRPRYPSRRPNLRRNPFPAYRQSARPTSRTNRRPKIPWKSRRHRSTSSSKARRRLFSLGNPGGFGRFWTV